VSESNPNIITCDKCKIDASSDKEIFEYQEFLRVRFRGGYGSVFGDGDICEIDLCQRCLKEVLGAYIRVTPGELYP